MKTLRLIAAVLIAAVLIALPSLALAQSRFDQWDRNKDGKLSKDELPQQLRRNFERVDRDGDGSISREEDARVGRQRNPKGNTALPESIEVLENLPYAENDNPRQALDLYLPKERGDEPLPLVVFIHGGGWRAGSKDGAGRRLVPFLADGKLAGASVGYRLTDEASWPSQIHDCKAAIRWLRGNAKKYNLDPEKIAVWGSSAGGHLVAMLGVSGEVAELEGDLGAHDGESSRVQAVVDYYGPTELHAMNDYEDYPSTMNHNAPDSPESKLVGGPIRENLDTSKSASPVTHVSKDDAPILIVHGTKDPLVPYPQSTKLDNLLDEAGVESTLITVENGGHGQGFPPELQGIIRAFLDRHLHGAGDIPQEITLPAAARR